MEITWSQIWAMRWMRQHWKVQALNCVSCCCTCVRPGVVVLKKCFISYPIRSILLFNTERVSMNVESLPLFLFQESLQEQHVPNSKKTVNMTFPAEACVLNFFFFFWLRWLLMAVFHGLPFVLRVIMMDLQWSSLRSSHLLFQSVPGVPEKCELFQLSFHQTSCRYPSGTNFSESKNTNSVSHSLLRSS